MPIIKAMSRSAGARPRTPAAEDALLLERLAGGDDGAFEAIFKRHYPPLLSFCRHMLGDRQEAEDALQQTFIRAHRALLENPPPRELRPWLYGIARNRCLSAIAARRPAVALEDRAPSLVGLSDQVREREDLRELLADIARLPERQRSALLLAEVDDLSHQAIAGILGCEVSKVKALIYQARSALIADRDARNTSCQDIRERLAIARGGELRRGPLRRHLKLCAGCRGFQEAVNAQRGSLATILPVLPSAGLAARVLGHGAAHAVTAIGQTGAALGPAGASASSAASGASSTGALAAASGGSLAATGGASGGGMGVMFGGGVVAKVAIGGVLALAASTTGALAVVHGSARPHTASVSGSHSGGPTVVGAGVPGGEPVTALTVAPDTHSPQIPGLAVLGSEVPLSAFPEAVRTPSTSAALQPPAGSPSSATAQQPSTAAHRRAPGRRRALAIRQRRARNRPRRRRLRAAERRRRERAARVRREHHRTLRASKPLASPPADAPTTVTEAKRQRRSERRPSETNTSARHTEAQPATITAPARRRAATSKSQREEHEERAKLSPRSAEDSAGGETQSGGEEPGPSGSSAEQPSVAETPESGSGRRHLKKTRSPAAQPANL